MKRLYVYFITVTVISAAVPQDLCETCVPTQDCPLFENLNITDQLKWMEKFPCGSLSKNNEFKVPVGFAAAAIGDHVCCSNNIWGVEKSDHFGTQIGHELLTDLQTHRPSDSNNYFHNNYESSTNQNEPTNKKKVLYHHNNPTSSPKNEDFNNYYYNKYNRTRSPQNNNNYNDSIDPSNHNVDDYNSKTNNNYDSNQYMPDDGSTVWFPDRSQNYLNTDYWQTDNPEKKGASHDKRYWNDRPNHEENIGNTQRPLGNEGKPPNRYDIPENEANLPTTNNPPPNIVRPPFQYDPPTNKARPPNQNNHPGSDARSPVRNNPPGHVARQPNQYDPPGNDVRPPGQNYRPGNDARPPGQNYPPGNVARPPYQYDPPANDARPSDHNYPPRNDARPPGTNYPHGNDARPPGQNYPPENVARPPDQNYLLGNDVRPPGQNYPPGNIARPPYQYDTPGNDARLPDHNYPPGNDARPPGQNYPPGNIARPPNQYDTPRNDARPPGQNYPPGNVARPPYQYDPHENDARPPGQTNPPGNIASPPNQYDPPENEASHPVTNSPPGIIVIPPIQYDPPRNMARPPFQNMPPGYDVARPQYYDPEDTMIPPNQYYPPGNSGPPNNYMPPRNMGRPTTYFPPANNNFMPGPYTNNHWQPSHNYDQRNRRNDNYNYNNNNPYYTGSPYNIFNQDYNLGNNGGGQCSLTSFPPDPQSDCCGRQLADDDRITGWNNRPAFTNHWTTTPSPRSGPIWRGRRSTSENDVEVTVENRISGGHATELYQYPWTVLLLTTFDYGKREAAFNCGGGLISAKYVLTAGHCVYDKGASVKSVKVNLAEYDKNSFPKDCKSTRNGRRCIDNVVMYAEEVITHPQYENENLVNDIALLRLRGSAPYTEYIRPICLTTMNTDEPQFSNLQFEVAGWGRIGPYSSNIKQSTVLHLVNHNQCKQYYPQLTNRHLCAAGKKGEDTCKGDSGGPLMILHRGKYHVAGIVSGKRADSPCGTSVPSLYTNVYHYVDWIRSIIRN